MPRSSWEMVKDLMVDSEKRELLADRAESLLLCLRQQFPGLPQTALDMSKIQHNKVCFSSSVVRPYDTRIILFSRLYSEVRFCIFIQDVGKSILESYSRVLESLAFNIVARIDDLLYVDDVAKHSDHLSPISKVSIIAHKTVKIPNKMPTSGTPYKTAFTTPNFSSEKGEWERSPLRSPFLSSSGKIISHGFGVKKALNNYLIDAIGNVGGCKDNYQEAYTISEASPIPIYQEARPLDSAQRAVSPSSKLSTL